MISDLVAKAIFVLKADTSDLVRGLRQVQGEEKKTLEAQLKTANARNEQYDTLLKYVGKLTTAFGAVALVGKAISSIFSSNTKETNEVRVSMLRYSESLLMGRVATEQMRKVSVLLGQDLKATANAFLDVAGATSNLNLSHQKLVDITKSLGVIMKNEGKSISDVGGVMQTLEFAISKGSISAGEMANIMKNFRPIAAIWREEFGATDAQLLKAAESGQLAKLGLDRLVTSIRTTSESVDKLKTGWAIQNETLDLSAKAFQHTWEGLDIIRMKADELPDANRKLIDSWDTTGKEVTTLAGGFDLLTTKVTELWVALNQLAKDPWGDNRNSLAMGIDQATSMIGHFWEVAGKQSAKYRTTSAASKKKRDEMWNDVIGEMLEPRDYNGGYDNSDNLFDYRDEGFRIGGISQQPGIPTSLLDAYAPGGKYGPGGASQSLYEQYQNRKLEGIFGPLSDFDAYKTAFETLNGAIGSAFGAWIDGSASAGEAFKKFIGEALKGVAVQMAMEAVKHGAYALGSLAFGNFAGAALHAKAAAGFAAGAIVVGAAAKGLGGSSSQQQGSSAPGGGVPAYSGGNNQGGGSETRIIAYGQSFSDDSARMRQVRAERILDDARRSGDGAVSYP